MTFPDPDDLPNALITHACGLTAASAAAELICAHGTWLTNPGFVDGYITTGIHASGQPYAYIHWDEVIAALNAHRIGGSAQRSASCGSPPASPTTTSPSTWPAASATSTTSTSASSPPRSLEPTAAAQSELR